MDNASRDLAAALALRVAGQTDLTCQKNDMTPLRPTYSAKGFSNKSLISQDQLYVFHSLSARIDRVNQGVRDFFSKSPGISCLSSEHIVVVSPSLIWAGRTETSRPATLNDRYGNPGLATEHM